MLDPDADALTIAAVRAAARVVDRAGDGGPTGYAAGVLGSLMHHAGIDRRSTAYRLEGVNREPLARAMAAELERVG